MADAIPEGYYLFPNRFLVLQDEEIECMGTIVQSPQYPHPLSNFQLTRSTYSWEEVGEEYVLVAHQVSVGKVIFNKDLSQEIAIDGTDYFLVSEENIYAFYEEEE